MQAIERREFNLPTVRFPVCLSVCLPVRMSVRPFVCLLTNGVSNARKLVVAEHTLLKSVLLSGKLMPALVVGSVFAGWHLQLVLQARQARRRQAHQAISCWMHTQ